MNIEKNVNTTIIQQNQSPLSFYRALSIILWLLFFGNVAILVFNFPKIPEWSLGHIFKLNGFTFLIWSTVTFFSAIVSSYSENYLKGFKYHTRFMILCLGFTLSVMILVASNHIIPFLLAWFAMGVFMSKLIGVNTNWKESREAAKFTQKYFLAGSIFLTIGVLIAAFQSNAFTLSGLTANWSSMPFYILLLSSLCIIIAAIIQSAIYPFHKWLLSAMTAPTPASALMHAGFVNGSGILLALFSTLLFESNTLNILFVIGGLTAIIAQFTKLLQVNVKQKLACSTIAQMGFMVMQCGLGFFNAAVVHLILHGFYKAYLFLSSGEVIEHSNPQKSIKIKINLIQALAVLLFGILGAILFTTLTGKGTSLDSGIFLTLIVAITVGQLTYNIVKQKNLSVVQKIIFPPVLFIAGIGVYALMYNAVTVLMADMITIPEPLPLSTIQIVFGIVFLIGFFIMKLGIYRQVPWLYIKLLNASQPYKKTVFNS
ncbi:proton-conducting transporter membrane subunit [Yeosuana marina]|uniref:proton-conducting transporter transmembrane domain-containing protein n=1 Tax=Yeosuana marina TaxID=1565536 RepID=UPI0030C8852C